MSCSLQPHGLKHARLPCPSPTPRACSNSCPSSQWCHPTISFSVIPSPDFNLSQHQGLFQWDSSSHQVAKVLELQLQHQSSQWIFRTDLRIDLLALVTIHFTYLSYVFTISPRKYTLPKRRDLCPICFQFCSHWLESITSCTSVHIC